jgi:hypothetical protein
LSTAVEELTMATLTGTPVWKMIGGIFLAGAMGIGLSSWPPEGRVAAQTTPTSQPAPNLGARFIDKSLQADGTLARLILYETTPPPLEELQDRAAKSAAGSRPIPDHGAMVLAGAPGPLSGYAFNPYLGTTFSGTPSTQRLTFDGLVEGQAAPGAYVAIDILTNPPPGEEAKWIQEVARANLSTTTTSQFWSVRKAIFDAALWPDGGVARYRARWVNPGFDSGVLTHIDTTGSVAETAHSILTDIDPSPTENSPTPNYLNALDSRFPHYAPSEATEQEAATKAYYEGIGINADGTGPPADPELDTLEKFKMRYGFHEETVYRAKYYNKGDLGIGRDMNCVFNSTTRENACYVRNFAPKDPEDPSGKKNLFGDADRSMQIMLDDGAPFATVAMVERDRMPTDAWNRTFFIVYGPPPDEMISTGPVALDNKGYNTFVPGNCMVCHGGGGTYDPDTNRLKHAYFLPFDQDAFEYLSTDPTDPLSREGLHDTFRSMNREVYFSGLWYLDTSRMVRAWYQDSFATGQFNGLALPTAIVSDWGANRHSTNVYKYVYATACRTCHISNVNGALAFKGWTEWKSLAIRIYDDMCGAEKKMPNAEQTLKLGWEASPSPRAYFLGHTPGVTGACNP